MAQLMLLRHEFSPGILSAANHSSCRVVRRAVWRLLFTLLLLIGGRSVQAQTEPTEFIDQWKGRQTAEEYPYADSLRILSDTAIPAADRAKIVEMSLEYVATRAEAERPELARQAQSLGGDNVSRVFVALVTARHGRSGGVALRRMADLFAAKDVSDDDLDQLMQALVLPLLQHKEISPDILIHQLLQLYEHPGTSPGRKIAALKGIQHVLYCLISRKTSRETVDELTTLVQRELAIPDNNAEVEAESILTLASLVVEGSVEIPPACVLAIQDRYLKEKCPDQLREACGMFLSFQPGQAMDSVIEASFHILRDAGQHDSELVETAVELLEAKLNPTPGHRAALEELLRQDDLEEKFKKSLRKLLTSPTKP